MDELEKLYTKLNEKGLYTKSLDDFRAQFSSPDKQDILYKSLNDKGLYTKTGDEFKSQFFTVKKKDSGEDSQLDSADVYKKFFDVTPKTEPFSPIGQMPSDQSTTNDAVSGATSAPVIDEDIPDAISGASNESFMVNIMDSDLLKGESKKKQLAQDRKNSLRAGYATAKSMIAGIPNFINRGFASVALSKNDLAELNKLPEDQKEFIINMAVSADPNATIKAYGDLSQLGAEKQNELTDLAEEYRAKVTQYEGNIFDDIKSGNGEDAFNRVVNSAIESAPSMMVALIPYVGLPLVGAGTAGQKQEEQERAGEPLNMKTVANSMINGVAEYWFERYTVGMIKPLQGIFIGNKTGAIKTAKEVFKGIAKDFGIESSSEAATAIVQEGADALYKGEFNLAQFSKNVFDAGLIGGFVGGGIGGAKGMANYTVYRTSNTEEKQKYDNDIKTIDELEESKTPENSLDIDNQIEGIETEVKDFKKNKVIEFEGLDYVDKKKVVDLSQKIDGIDRTLNTTKGDLSIESEGKVRDDKLELERKKQNILEKKEVETTSKTTENKTELDVVKDKETYKTSDVIPAEDAKTFVKAQQEAMSKRTDDKLQVDILTEKEAQQIIDEGGKLFITTDGKAGGYVKSDGYMGGVFKDPTSTKDQAAKALQEVRVKAGGKFFDAYGTHLEDIYIKNGFEPLVRMPFDEKQAPKGWEDTNLKSKPDNVFFVYNPSGNYKKGDGVMETSYDKAYSKAEEVSQTTGQQNEAFFTEKAKQASSKIPYKPVIKVDTKSPVAKAYAKFSAEGNFTGHISKMIAGFQEKQKQVAEAIVKGGFKRFLDIGTSEGGMIKTVASQNESVTAVGIDPNSQMKVNFESTPEVKNAEFKQEGFQGTWTEKDGTPIKEFKSKEKFDVINEDFTFQFVNNNREKQVKGVKEMMTPDGIFVTSEKFVGTKNYSANEKKKNIHQKKYFSKEEITKDKQEIVVGMEKDMVNDVDYMNTLKKHFKYVEEFWNAGNFKGFLASDNIDVLNEFKKNVGNLDTEFTDKGSETRNKAEKVIPKSKTDAKKVQDKKGTIKQPIKDKIKETPKRNKDKKQDGKKSKAVDKRDKTTKAKSAVGKLNTEINRLKKYEDKTKQVITAQAKKAISAIKKLFPEVKIELKNTEKDFIETVGKEFSDSKGVYVTDTKTVYINMEMADEATVAHEIFHAIIVETIIGNNSKRINTDATNITKEMLSSMLKAIPKDKKNGNLFKGIKEFISKNYDKRVVDEEFLAHVFGFISDNSTSLSPSALNKVKVWINKLAKLFGLDVIFNKSAKGQEVIDFLNTLSDKLKRGQEITKADVKVIKDKITTDNKKGDNKDKAPETREQKVSNTPVSVQRKALEAFKKELEKSESNREALSAAITSMEGYHVTKQQMVEFIKEIAPELFKKYDVHYIMQKEFSKEEKDAWDGSITMAQGVINDGGSIGKAIAEGVQTMRDSEWWQNQPQEEKDYSMQQFKSKIRDAFEIELNAEDKAIQDKVEKVGNKMKTPTLFERSRVKWQDRMYPLKKVLRLLEKEQIKVPDELNPYILETLQKGRAEQAIEDILNKVMDLNNPNSLFSRMQKEGINQLQLGNYMLAEHAVERNDAKHKELIDMLDILEGRSKDPDIDVKGYKKALQKSFKVTKIEKEIKFRIKGLENGTYAGYGMNTNDAQKIIDKVNKDPKKDLYDGFSEEYRQDVIAESLRRKYEVGLISEDTYNLLSDVYKKYVPMMVEEIDEVGTNVGGIGNAMVGLHRIKGDIRERVRKNPLLSGFEQFTSSVMNAEMNRTGLGLLELTEQMKGNDFMEVISEQDYASKPEQKKEHVIKVVREGEDYYINIYDKELAISLKKSMSKGGDVIKFMNRYNTWMRNVLTQLNPAFMAPNYVRDFKMAYMNLPKEVKAKVGIAEFTKMSMQSFADIRNYRGKRKTGKAPTTKGGRQYKELLQMGGVSKWGVLSNPQKIADEIAEMISTQKDPSMKSLFKEITTKVDKQTLDRVRRMGDYMEHANRLAIYKASRKALLSKERSAFEAKEGTINFDRNGDWGKALNTFFLFSNAGIQGTTRMLHTIKESPAVAVKLMAKIASFAATMVGMMYAFGMGDAYEEESEWDKMHYIYFPFYITIGGKRELFRLPSPYGMGFVPYIGQKSVEMLMTEKPVDWMDLVKAFGGAVGDVINPLGAGLPLPTSVKPFIEVTANLNYMLNPIFAEDLKGKNIVKSESGFRKTGEGYKEFAKIINKMSSGNENESGMLDFAPEAYRHIIESLGGGVWSFFKNSKEFLNKDEDYKIPVLRRFMGVPSERVYTNRLRDYYKRSGNSLFSDEELRDLDKTFTKAISEGYMTPDNLKFVFTDIVNTQIIKKVAHEQSMTPEEFTGDKAKKDAIYDAMKEFRAKKKK